MENLDNVILQIELLLAQRHELFWKEQILPCLHNRTSLKPSKLWKASVSMTARKASVPRIAGGIGIKKSCASAVQSKQGKSVSGRRWGRSKRRS